MKKTNDTDQKQSDDKPFMFRFIPGFVHGPQLKKLRLIEHRLLWIMLDYASNTDGTFFLGIKHACELSGMDSGDVRSGFRGLVEKGICEVTKKGGGRKPGSNKGLATEWRLLIGPGVKPNNKNENGELTGAVQAPVKQRYRGCSGPSYTGARKPDTGAVQAPSTTHPQPLICSTTHPPTQGRVGESSTKANTSKDTETRSERKRMRLDKDEKMTTSDSPSDIEVPLMDATGLSRKKDEPWEEWLERLIEAVGDLSEDEWANSLLKKSVLPALLAAFFPRNSMLACATCGPFSTGC
jgi:hypothetical protein